jgi:hypothetical protein
MLQNMPTELKIRTPLLSFSESLMKAWILSRFYFYFQISFTTCNVHRRCSQTYNLHGSRGSC